jgi:glutathione S-transferase-like protein
MAMSLKLFELVGADSMRPFSPFCWRTRMALAHKGLDCSSIPWRFTEKAMIAPHGSDKVPVLLHGETAVAVPGRSRIIWKTIFRTGRRCSAARAAVRPGA